MNLDLGILFKRLTGRRVCQDCGQVFNVHTSPPGAAAHSEQCGDTHRLIQRPDDKEEVIGKRLEVYEAQTKPLIKYYEAAGLLRIVDADADVDRVFKSIERARALGSRPTALIASSSRVPIASRRQPVRACVSRLPMPQGCLELAARRENFRADLEFGRARIDDLAQAFDHGLLLGSRARILRGCLVLRTLRCLLERDLQAGRQAVVQRRQGALRNGENCRVGQYPGARQVAGARQSSPARRRSPSPACAPPAPAAPGRAASPKPGRGRARTAACLREPGSPRQPSARARVRAAWPEAGRRPRRGTAHRRRRIPAVLA